MNRSVLGLTTALLMSALIIGGCGSNQDDHDTSLKVRTITIGEEAGTTSAGYSGTIKNRTETNLAFQVGGRVINKFVSVGTAVQAGQVIAQINGADTASQVQNAQGAVTAAQSAYDLASTNAERYRALYAEQAISKLQLDQAENQLNAAKAQLQPYEEELEDVKEILSHEMVNAAKLHVPLEVDMHTGKNWYEAK